MVNFWLNLYHPCINIFVSHPGTMDKQVQKTGIVIEPRSRVGALGFRIDEHELSRLMGPPIRRLPMSYDRYMYVYAEQIDTVVYHKQYGVVGVSISIAPVLIDDRDLFSMSGAQLTEWLDSKALDYTASDSVHDAEFVDIDIPDWSVTVYLHNGRVDSVEAAYGTWKYGRLVEPLTDS